MHLHRWLVTVGLMCGTLSSVQAQEGAEVLEELADPDTGSDGWELPDWIDVGAEYRVRSIRIDPLDLSGTTVRDVNWTEQRARLDLALQYPGIASLHLQADILDGVLFGDNGTFGTEIIPNSGVSLTTRRPNNLGYAVGMIDGGDPLDPDTYAPQFIGVEPIQINHLWAQVNLPFGVIRFGRQPMLEGPGLAAHYGGRSNRWGVSEYADAADRVLFATKLSEAVGIIMHGSEHVPDLTMENGVFLGVGYDWMTQGDHLIRGDETRQVPTSIFWRMSEGTWFDVPVSDFELSVTAVHVFNSQFETAVWSFPTRLQGNFGNLSLMFQLGLNIGETREISEGFAVLSNTEPGIQKIRMWGINTVIDYNVGPVMFTMEFDYATGDADPRSGNALTQYSFSRDLNVGLLLFEHILAFESARSAEVGIENLSSLNSDSFPITEARTDGRFTNAIAVFPQVTFTALDLPSHRLHARVGALLAWSEEGVIDQILTVLAEDGNWIHDDAVNYHGGEPGDYLGTEIDLQLQYAFSEVFYWTLEGAILFPGDALEDEHGDAVNSYLFENRFEVVF